MTDITFTMPQEPERFELHAFADWHLEDPNCNEKIIREWIETVRTRDNAYCILNGDLLNTALKTSVSDIYRERLSPMEAMKYLIALLEPIKSKIIFIDEGNHEARLSKDTSIHMLEMVARELQVPFVEEGAVIYIQCGMDEEQRHPERRIGYVVYVTHGAGGGRTEGGKFNALAQLASIVDADIYIHSHVHLPGAFKRKYYRPNSNTKTTKSVTKLFVSTASALEYGGYGRKMKYAPSSTDNPVIYLDGRKRQADALV
ncbi:MAG: hypothetical protein VB062_04645 [Christensenella sp.]|nr:hypothetical protein [Christensenella sp.]